MIRILCATPLLLAGCSLLVGIEDPQPALSSQADAAVGGGPPDARVTQGGPDAAPPDASGPTQTIKVDFTGDGEGTVAIPGGKMCPPDCQVAFPQGTTISLTAKPRSWSRFDSWSAGPCNGNGECRIKLDGDAMVTAKFRDQSGGHNFVFVSTGKLSPVGLTLETADGLCAQSAATNHIPGNYVAFLATTAGTAPSRLTGSRGWVRLDGQPFANEIVDLRATQKILYPVLYEASGAPYGGFNHAIMTAANTDGSFANDFSCGGFTDSGAMLKAGDSETGAYLWSAFWTVPCTVSYPVYCFGVGRNVALANPPVEGRLVFLARVDNANTGGLATMDAACASDASTFGLPGTYKALVATPTASALSRFAAPDVIWSRADGVRITPPDTQPFQTTTPLNVINMRAGGGYAGNEIVLTGSLDLNTPGTADSTCNGWASASASFHAVIGSITKPAEWLGNSTSTPTCNFLGSSNVYCLQVQ